MIEMDAFDAKTHFFELLDIARKESVIITRQGQKIAMLTPIQEEMNTVNIAAKAVGTIRRLRKNVTLGKGLSIKDMKSEGRK
jgi:prevent-host-death family protein